jgi:RNA polymerase sigma-70 factor (ECF subfamily)
MPEPPALTGQPLPDLERYRNYLRFRARASMDPRLRQKMDPSDIVQETLIKAHRGVEDLRARDEAAVLAWLDKIFKNTLRNAHRDQHRRRRDASLEVPLDAFLARSSACLRALTGATGSSAARRLDLETAALRLADALAALTPDQSEAVILKYWHDWQLKDIGERLEKTSGAVAALLHRAIEKLRGYFAADGRIPW